MIEVKHHLSILSKCPVNGDRDDYRATISMYRVVPVEEIQAVVDELTKEPIFQEKLTEELAMRLEASVVTWGWHGKVETKCSASA